MYEFRLDCMPIFGGVEPQLARAPGAAVFDALGQSDKTLSHDADETGFSPVEYE